MPNEILEVKNLNLSYKGVQAVRDVSFSVQPGEVLAIIGPNGSGKTSAVECVEGLRRPDSGDIRVFGMNPLHERSKVYEKMGVQLQDVQYPARIRVNELCRLFASFYDRPINWEKLLPQVNLADKQKRLVSKLSGGEKQRLSLVLALMGRPRLLVLDELTTGLDPEVRQNMWATFETVRENGVAIVLVSHYMDEAQALADTILYLENAKQMFCGSLPEFRMWAKQRIGADAWSDMLSLEQLYLQIVPRTAGIRAEDVL